MEGSARATTLLIAGALALAAAAPGSPARSPMEAARYPGREWAVCTPAEAGLDAGRLAGVRDALDGRGCVVRHGYLAFQWGDIAARGDVASAAKPVYTHFLLKAWEDGRIPSLDERVVRYEPRLATLNPDGKDGRITWRHLATQTACYGVAEPPGAAFCYNDWQMALFWDLLFQKVYGAGYENVDARVLRPMLADPLGCQDQPTLTAFGPQDRPGRLAISPRDFARFGLLYLRGGRWRGRQLIRREHAAMVVRSPLPASLPRTTGRPAQMLPGQRSIGSRNIPDDQCDHLGSYSWLWWVNGVDRDGRRHWPGVPADAYGAFGHGGMRALVVIPSLDLVASWNDAQIERPDQEQAVLRLLVESATDR